MSVRKKLVAKQNRSYRLVLNNELATQYDQIKTIAKSSGYIFDPRPELIKAFSAALTEAEHKLREIDNAHP